MKSLEQIIGQYHTDKDGNPQSIHIIAPYQVSPIHNQVQLPEIPDEYKGIDVIDPTDMFRVYNFDEMKENTYYLNDNSTIIYFDKSMANKKVWIDFYGMGVQLIGADRVYTQVDANGNILETLGDIVENGKLVIEKIKNIGDAIVFLDDLKETNNTASIYLPKLLGAVNTGIPLEKSLRDLIDNGTSTHDKLKPLVDQGNSLKNELPALTQSANESTEKLNNILQNHDFVDKASFTQATTSLTQQSNQNKKNIQSLSSNFNQFNTFKNKFNFDISLIQPCFHTTLNLREGSCLQCLVVEENEMYATQVYEDLGSGRSQSFTINHLDKHGNLLDYMIIRYGGHGSSIAIEKDEGITYVWSNYDIAQADGTKLGTTVVRFPYMPNQTITWGDSKIERYKDFDDYAVPYIDHVNNKISFRIKYTDVHQVVELYDFSEFKAKRFNLLYSWSITPDLQFLQGFAMDNYDIYWRTGDANAEQYPDEISVIDIRTGQVKKRITCNFSNTNNADNYREPEGLFFYTNKNNGKRTLFAPVCTGRGGHRITKTYMYNEYGAYDEFAANVEEVTQQHELVQKGGYCKPLPDVNQLLDIDIPGVYYMTNGESKNFIDHPDQSTQSGWWLYVEPKNKNGLGEFFQKLRRNNLNHFDTWERLIRSKDEHSDWVRTL